MKNGVGCYILRRNKDTTPPHAANRRTVSSMNLRALGLDIEQRVVDFLLRANDGRIRLLTRQRDFLVHCLFH